MHYGRRRCAAVILQREQRLCKSTKSPRTTKRRRGHTAAQGPHQRPSTYCAKDLSINWLSLIFTIHSSSWKMPSLLERLFSSTERMCRPRALQTDTRTENEEKRHTAGLRGRAQAACRQAHRRRPATEKAAILIFISYELLKQNHRR